MVARRVAVTSKAEADMVEEMQRVNGGEQAGEALAGRWLPFAVSARRLGVSERTLRRHIADGRYQVRHEGRRAAVFLPGEVLAEQVAEPTSQGELALVHAIEALSAALAAERTRSERLEQRLMALDEERLALIERQSHASDGRAGG